MWVWSRDRDYWERWSDKQFSSSFGVRSPFEAMVDIFSHFTNSPPFLAIIHVSTGVEPMIIIWDALLNTWLQPAWSKVVLICNLRPTPRNPTGLHELCGCYVQLQSLLCHRSLGIRLPCSRHPRSTRIQASGAIMPAMSESLMKMFQIQWWRK